MNEIQSAKEDTVDTLIGEVFYQCDDGTFKGSVAEALVFADGKMTDWFGDGWEAYNIFDAGTLSFVLYFRAGYYESYPMFVSFVPPEYLVWQQIQEVLKGVRYNQAYVDLRYRIADSVLKAYLHIHLDAERYWREYGVLPAWAKEEPVPNERTFTIFNPIELPIAEFENHKAAAYLVDAGKGNHYQRGYTIGVSVLFDAVLPRWTPARIQSYIADHGLFKAIAYLGEKTDTGAIVVPLPEETA